MNPDTSYYTFIVYLIVIRNVYCNLFLNLQTFLSIFYKQEATNLHYALTFKGDILFVGNLTNKQLIFFSIYSIQGAFAGLFINRLKIGKTKGLFTKAFI